MTSHYTRRSVTGLHDFGGDLGQHLDTFLLGSLYFRRMLLCWERLVAHVRRSHALDLLNTTLFGLISVGYHLESRIAIAFF